MKKFTLTVLFILAAFTTFAQQISETPAPYAQRKFFDSTSYIIPLLVRAALKAAPEMKRSDAARRVADLDLKMAKNEILKQFYINGNYNYGSSEGNLINAVQGSSLNAFANNGKALYLVGINLNISLEQLFGGIHQRVEKQKSVVDEVNAERATNETAIRVKIITLYNALVLSKKLFEHSEDALQSANVNKELVDKQFKNGEIKVTDQMASNDLYSRAVVDEQTAKSNYQLNVLLMEEAIGMKLNQFIYDYVK